MVNRFILILNSSDTYPKRKDHAARAWSFRFQRLLLHSLKIQLASEMLEAAAYTKHPHTSTPIMQSWVITRDVGYNWCFFVENVHDTNSNAAVS